MNSPISPTAFSELISSQMSRVVYGMLEPTKLCTIALITGGHVLIEGVPGIGKTLFSETLMRLLALEMKRVQCTPDMLPGDVLGASIFDFQKQSFNLVRGPVFTECRQRHNLLGYLPQRD